MHIKLIVFIVTVNFIHRAVEDKTRRRVVFVSLKPEDSGGAVVK